MAKLIAVYDACILYPAALRDFLMWLALTDLFNARWTEEIHAEWMRNVLQNLPGTNLKQLTRTKILMNASIERSNLKNPPKTVDEYLETLLEQGLTKSVAQLKNLCYCS